MERRSRAVFDQCTVMYCCVLIHLQAPYLVKCLLKSEEAKEIPVPGSMGRTWGGMPLPSAVFGELYVHWVRVWEWITEDLTISDVRGCWALQFLYQRSVFLWQSLGTLLQPPKSEGSLFLASYVYSVTVAQKLCRIVENVPSLPSWSPLFVKMRLSTAITITRN